MLLLSDVTVLLIEDDGNFRRVIAGVLRDSGAVVHDHPSGEAAVEFAQMHAGAIDLLLTDTNLPGMNGLCAAETIRMLHPELPVIQMSGNPRDSQLARSIGGPTIRFLSKPFLAGAFNEALREALGSRARSVAA